ncbi:coiled-coil protein [Legionella moravica]|uniref:Coiled-coil protein n=1 Tax=Legionella moravica TaxID=39962 RepID=A0A378K270_9GAMM|nr:LbtU family siderophore porin [Legionella moravica]KTD39455.1 coiled-coil protein [Legionella moravica]STX63708.1 coiled-coil protein [Legionella moravica]
MAKFYWITWISALVMMCSFMNCADSASRLFDHQNVSYDGHLFFNATNSAAQGERYLLNQQLSNIKLGSEWRVTDWNKVNALLIYNTVPTPIAPSLYFEQLFDTFTLYPSQLFFEAGKKWLVFGRYKNDLIYKPLTKALGQTNEVTTVLSYEDSIYANVSFFDPYSRIKSSSLPVYYNLNIGVRDAHYDVGGSYLRSFAETQLSQYNKGFGGFLSQRIRSDVPGFSGYVNLYNKKWSAYLTYVMALRPFAKEDLSYNNKGAQPKAFSMQTAYELKINTIPFKMIGFYDHSSQALALRLPKQRVGVGFSFNPYRYLSLQFQYFKDYGYPANATASGLNRWVVGNSVKVNNFAVQAVVNF